MENFKFDLQIFADAGTVVNATGGYVNSGTGEVTGFTDGKTLSPELKAFYDTELLENARTEMFYAQFAKRQPLPPSGTPLTARQSSRRASYPPGRSSA
mgnify:CR=1 FL=1